MELGKFFHTKTGKYIMSLLLGFGLATLFRKTCKKQDCIRFKGPSKNDIKDKTYKFNNDCYKFESNAVTCDINKQSAKM